MTANAEPQPNSAIASIIDELNANPELKPVLLRAILTEEFLLLPAKVDRLAELYGELAATVDHLATRVDELTSTVTQLTAKVGELTAKVGELTIRVSDLETNYSRVNGQLGNLLGEQYERRIARSIRSKAHSELGIRRAQVLQGETTTDYDSLLDAASEAREGTDRFFGTGGLRAVWRRHSQRTAAGGGGRRRAAVGVSVTVRDITRAAERADILAQVMDCPAAVVVGDSISDFDRNRAKTLGVEVLIIAE